MRAKRKADYHHGNLRRALIDAAVSAIAKHGVDALNLRQLAARAGVTPGAPYHHFTDREELLAAIAEEGFGRLGAELIAGRDAAGDEASARLEALGRAYINFAISCPGYFRVMFHGDGKSSGPSAPGLRAFHLLRDAVLACQEAVRAIHVDDKVRRYVLEIIQGTRQHADILLGGFASVQSIASSPGASAAWVQHVADDGHFGPDFT